MTDFYARLDRSLHEAAGRRARHRGLLMPRPAVVVAVAAAAAVLALAAVVLSGARDAAEREVDLPAAPATGLPCGDVTGSFAVLRRPADGDVPQAVTAAVQDTPAVTAADLDGARLASSAGEAAFWAVPVCLGERPAACLVMQTADTALTDCGSLQQAARGGVRFDGTVAPSRAFTAALLPDGHDGVVVDVEGDVYDAPVTGNVAYAAYPDRGRRAVLRTKDGWTPYAPLDACGPDVVPAGLVERFAVLRRPPGQPREFGDLPGAAQAFPDAARPVRFANGLTAVAVPVLLGRCEAGDVDPGICLVPDDAGWEHRCVRVGDGPTVLSLERANEFGETEVAGIASDDVRAVFVSAPQRGFDVETEAGRFSAATPDADPADVGVSPYP